MYNEIVLFVASFLIFILFFGLFILWIIDGNIKKEQVLHALFAIIIAWFTCHLIKDIFPTTRPFLRFGEDPMTLTTPSDPSFPSIHTAIAFALSVTIFLHDRKIGWVYLLGALLVGVARVLANVHYPIDIWGGALIGTLVSVVIEKTHLKKLLTLSRR